MLSLLNTQLWYQHMHDAWAIFRHRFHEITIASLWRHSLADTNCFTLLRKTRRIHQKCVRLLQSSDYLSAPLGIIAQLQLWSTRKWITKQISIMSCFFFKTHCWRGVFISCSAWEIILIYQKGKTQKWSTWCDAKTLIKCFSSWRCSPKCTTNGKSLSEMVDNDLEPQTNMHCKLVVTNKMDVA